MALKRRIFTRDFKLQVVREVDAGKSMAQVSREHQLNPNTIAKWRKQLRQYPNTAFAGRGNHYTDEARVAELERMVGKLTMENDLLKKALALLDERAASKTGNGSSK
jgi:transposase